MRAIGWAIVLVWAGAAQAQGPCPAIPAPLPAQLAGWSVTTPLAAAPTAAAARTMVQPSAARRVTLFPVGRVRLATPPRKPGDAASHAGLVAFDVPRAGAYRIALSDAAWIDVVVRGRAVESIGHGHGPPCSTIRKIVDFELEPGRHLLQIAGARGPEITMMVAPAR